MASIVMASIVMAYTAMAYVVMAYIVMAYIWFALQDPMGFDAGTLGSAITIAGRHTNTDMLWTPVKDIYLEAVWIRQNAPAEQSVTNHRHADMFSHTRASTP